MVVIWFSVYGRIDGGDRTTLSPSAPAPINQRLAPPAQSPLTRAADTIVCMYEQLARAKELAARISDILVRL